ncbi:MAG: regulatory protein GemA [Bacteroidetes bacterium]|nr:regulatory protein GemA [Bacteroidota bacterium]
MPDNIRRKEIAAIQIGCKQLFGSDEDARRAFLEEATGKRSTKDLTAEERRRVLETLRQNGFARSRERVRIDPEADTPQVQRIKQLWLTLCEKGAAKSDEVVALNAWIKRSFHVDHVRWLSPEQASKAIEMLKAWLGRLRPGTRRPGTRGRAA